MQPKPIVISDGNGLPLDADNLSTTTEPGPKGGLERAFVEGCPMTGKIQFTGRVGVIGKGVEGSHGWVR